MNTPKLFRVIFKEHLIERFSEAVDIEVFQIRFFATVNLCSYISESCFHGSSKTHVVDRGPLERNRIIEEFMKKINSGNTVSIKA